MSPVEKEEVSKALKQEAAQRPELAENLGKRGLSMEQLTREASDAIKDMGSDEEVQEAVHEFLVNEGLVKEESSESGGEPPPSKGEEKKEAPKEKGE